MAEYIIYEPCINRAEHIGKGTKIGAFCDLGANVIIGEKCNIQSSVTISNGVRIGNRVFIGPHCSLLNDKYIDGGCQPCVIEDDVRIGGHSVILPEVILRKGTLVGAGSVVVDSFPEYSIIYGNPATIHQLNR